MLLVALASKICESCKRTPSSTPTDYGKSLHILSQHINVVCRISGSKASIAYPDVGGESGKVLYIELSWDLVYVTPLKSAPIIWSTHFANLRDL